MDWLVAAYLQYKPPTRERQPSRPAAASARHSKAVENTIQMGKLIRGAGGPVSVEQGAKILDRLGVA